MKRLLIALAIAALSAPALASPPRPQFLQAFEPEHARSPDGRARISTMPGDDKAGDDDPRSMNSLWLRDGARPRRLVVRFPRTVDLFWTHDGRRLVVVARSLHKGWIYVVDRRGAGQASDEINRRIEALMPRVGRGAPLGTVENRFIVIERLDDVSMTIKVEEDGLPPGRDEGSFVSRERRFRITYAPLTVTAL